MVESVIKKALIMKTYYKVTSSDLASAIVTDEDAVQYEPNKWVYPRYEGSLIFAFNSAEAADLFKRQMAGSPHQIWRCHVKGERPIKRRASITCVKNFWQAIRNKKSPEIFAVNSIPSGTIGCKKLKLLSRIS